MLHVFSECLEDVTDKDYIRHKEGQILDTVDKISEFFKKKWCRESLKCIVGRIKVWRGQWNWIVKTDVIIGAELKDWAPVQKLKFTSQWRVQTAHNKYYVMSSIRLQEKNSPSHFRKYHLTCHVAFDLHFIDPVETGSWYSYAYHLQYCKYILNIIEWLFNEYVLENIILIAHLNKLKKRVESTCDVRHFKNRTIFRI